MLSYALLGIIINHPSPAPSPPSSGCLSLCGAVMCWCCAQPSAALCRSSAVVSFGVVWLGLVMVPFGMLPVWIGRTAGLGLVSALWCVWASFARGRNCGDGISWRSCIKPCHVFFAEYNQMRVDCNILDGIKFVSVRLNEINSRLSRCRSLE